MTGGRKSTIILFNIAMLTSNVQTITPEYAAELLAKNFLNRPVNKITVDDYAAQMSKDLWKLNGEPILISSTGNLIDGQHRLHACIQSGKPFQTVIITGVDASTFDTIDTGRIRTGSDSLNILGISNAAAISSIISSYFKLKKNDACYTDSNNTLRTIKMSKQEVRAFYQAHSELIDTVYRLSRRCYDHVRLLSSAVIGAYAMYLILDKQHSEEKVSSFFNELFGLEPCTNKTLDVLRTSLNRHVLKQKILTPLQKATYIKRAWNSYVTGKELSNLPYNKDRDASLQFI